MQTLVLRNVDKVFLRSLRPGDSLKQLADYINAFVLEKSFITVERPVSLREEKNWLEKNLKEIRGGRQLCLVAEGSCEIAGIAQAKKGVGKERDVVELSLSVSQKFRGLGLGEALLRELIALARRKLRPRVIYLACFGSNKPAFALYKKLGFREVARLPKWFNHFGRLEDCVFMVLR